MMLNGHVLDLTQLSAEEDQFLQRCTQAYRAGVDWLALGGMADSKDNPLVRATGGWITRAVWEHPLYRAARDMEARLAIRQGEMAPGPDDNAQGDPFAAVEETVPAGRR